MIGPLPGMSCCSGSFIRYIWTTTRWLGMWSFPKQVPYNLCTALTVRENWRFRSIHRWMNCAENWDTKRCEEEITWETKRSTFIHMNYDMTIPNLTYLMSFFLLRSSTSFREPGPAIYITGAG
jgi:hypothetical protein